MLEDTWFVARIGGGKLDTRRVNRTVKIVCEILADEFLRK